MPLVLRGLTEVDIPGWGDLLAAIEGFDRTGHIDDEAGLAELFVNPETQPGDDFTGAFQGDELVGYCCVLPRPPGPELHDLGLTGGVHPARRGQGIGTLLGRRMLERGRELHAARAPGRSADFHARGLAEHHEQAELLGGLGLEPRRWSFLMRAGLDALAPTPAMPSGLRVSTFDPARDAEHLLETHNTVFLDHPGFTPWSESEWERGVLEGRSARHDASFVVTGEHGEIAAYLQTTESEAHTRATGRREAYVARMGVRREHRGQGLAGALLGRALEVFRAQGYDDAALDVLADNPTGALGVYERAGFEIVSRWTTYRLLESTA